jgi:hypothetical protein
MYTMSSQPVMDEIGSKSGREAVDEDASKYGHEALQHAMKGVNKNGM